MTLALAELAKDIETIVHEHYGAQPGGVQGRCVHDLVKYIASATSRERLGEVVDNLRLFATYVDASGAIDDRPALARLLRGASKMIQLLALLSDLQLPDDERERRRNELREAARVVPKPPESDDPSIPEWMRDAGLKQSLRDAIRVGAAGWSAGIMEKALNRIEVLEKQVADLNPPNPPATDAPLNADRAGHIKTDLQRLTQRQPIDTIAAITAQNALRRIRELEAEVDRLRKGDEDLPGATKPAPYKIDLQRLAEGRPADASTPTAARLALKRIRTLEERLDHLGKAPPVDAESMTDERLKDELRRYADMFPNTGTGVVVRRALNRIEDLEIETAGMLESLSANSERMADEVDVEKERDALKQQAERLNSSLKSIAELIDNQRPDLALEVVKDIVRNALPAQGDEGAERDERNFATRVDPGLPELRTRIALAMRSHEGEEVETTLNICDRWLNTLESERDAWKQQAQHFDKYLGKIAEVLDHRNPQASIEAATNLVREARTQHIGVGGGGGEGQVDDERGIPIGDVDDDFAVRGEFAIGEGEAGDPPLDDATEIDMTDADALERVEDEVIRIYKDLVEIKQVLDVTPAGAWTSISKARDLVAASIRNHLARGWAMQSNAAQLLELIGAAFMEGRESSVGRYANSADAAWDNSAAKLQADAIMLQTPGPATPSAFYATHRHKVRPGDYQLLNGYAILQMSTDRPLRDHELMAVYRSKDGIWWVRSNQEFNDGRFEAVPMGKPVDIEDTGGSVNVRAIHDALHPAWAPREMVAQSIASIVENWVESGMGHGCDWRIGLTEVVDLALLRFEQSPAPVMLQGEANGYEGKPIDARRDRFQPVNPERRVDPGYSMRGL